MPHAYPLDIQADPDGGFVGGFPDVPGTVTQADTETALLDRADDLLLVGLYACIRQREAIPAPSPARGRPTVRLPALAAAKVELYEALRKDGRSQSAFARDLGVRESQVRRLIDLRWRSHIDEVERALAALGRRLEVTAKAA